MEIQHPTSQSRSDAPGQTVDSEEGGPDLGDTPVLDSALSQQTILIRSQLEPNVRENLQRLEKGNRGCANRARPETPPVPEGAIVASGPGEPEPEVHTPFGRKNTEYSNFGVVQNVFDCD